MWEPVTFISDIEQQKERTQKGRTEKKNKGYNVETKKTWLVLLTLRETHCPLFWAYDICKFFHVILAYWRNYFVWLSCHFLCFVFTAMFEWNKAFQFTLSKPIELS